MLSHLMPLVRPGRRHKRRKSENLPELDVFIVLGNKDDKKEKIIAIVFINVTFMKPRMCVMCAVVWRL